jgi:hypothetical protein
VSGLMMTPCGCSSGRAGDSGCRKSALLTIFNFHIPCLAKVVFPCHTPFQALLMQGGLTGRIPPSPAVATGETGKRLHSLKTTSALPMSIKHLLQIMSVIAAPCDSFTLSCCLCRTCGEGPAKSHPRLGPILARTPPYPYRNAATHFERD